MCVSARVYLLYMQPCTDGLHQSNQHLFSNVVGFWNNKRVELIALILSVVVGEAASRDAASLCGDFSDVRCKNMKLHRELCFFHEAPVTWVALHCEGFQSKIRQLNR